MNRPGLSLAAMLGAVLHAERTARRMSQQELAEAAGLHPMALSKLERGVQADVGVGTLQRLARGLGSTASTLLATAEGWEARAVAAGLDPTLRGGALAAAVSLLEGVAASASEPGSG